MKREQYVAPVTRRFSVELEGGFTSASIVQGTQSGVTSTGQEINEINGNEFTGDGGWNDSTWE